MGKERHRNDILAGKEQKRQVIIFYLNQSTYIYIYQYIMKKEIGDDIIKMYFPYKNKNTEWVKTTVGEYTLTLPKEYEPLQILGKGAYGIVVAAKDQTHEGQYVAIKKMNNVFQHKIFARRTLRQLRLLRLIEHDNVISIKTIILPKSREQFDDLYVVFELMDTDLTNVIRNQKNLTSEHQKFFMYQILRALKYLHSCQIVHRDLKPRNILLDAECDVKICDFGLSRPMVEETKAHGLTDYVTTRWYRAPQLLLGQTNYTSAVDIWSLGCIFAQILFKKPILTANSTQEQIKVICECLGMPDFEAMPPLSEQSKLYIKKICKKNKKPPTFEKMADSLTEDERDLLKNLLAFQPKNRMTAQKALEHPYFKKLHLEEDEPEGTLVDFREFQFEDYNLTTQQLKDLLYEEILLYNYPGFKKSYELKKNNSESLIHHILNNSNKTNIDPNADNDE